MTTHELLVAAKTKLVRDGWHQGDMCPSGEDGSKGPVCALGSLYVVTGGDVDAQTSKLVLDAGAALEDQVGLIPLWNDDETRTFEEVIDAFDKAIVATAPKDTPALAPKVEVPA